MVRHNEIIIVVISVVILLSLPTVLGSTIAETIVDQQINPSQTTSNGQMNGANIYRKRYMIFGFGDILGMGTYNLSWGFGLFYRALFKTDLLVINYPGMYNRGYCFFIKDLNSGVIFNKTSLPEDVYICNYTGYIRAKPYSVPHGPFGIMYTMFGFADDWYEYHWQTS